MIKRIAEGEWRAGEAIPNEIDLAREFGLSAGTVRKALDWMESAQLVVRQQGRGTFVRDQTSGELLTRYSNIRKADGTPVDDAVSAAKLTIGAATAVEAGQLAMQAGEKVYRIQQTRVAEGAAYARENLILPCALFPGLEGKAPGVKNIGEIAFANGLLLGNGRERISIGSASEEVASALGLPAGKPVLVLDRIMETIDGRPAEWRVTCCHLGAYVYQARIG